MRSLFFVCLFFTASVNTALGQSLEELLLPKVAALDTAKSTDTWQQVANEFERIALAHPKSWHANYYAAYSYTLLALMAPKDEIDALADRAAEYLNAATSIRPDDAENHILVAYLLSARINVNPMMRGASMGRESKTHLTAALELEPNNPRGLYVRGMGIFHTPAVFGGGKKKAKPYLDKALEIFGNTSHADPLEPHWGGQETEKLLMEYL